MKTGSKASRPAPSAVARNVAAAVNFETPTGLTRAQRYAWTSRKLGRDMPAVATWHWRLDLLVNWYGSFRRDGTKGVRDCAHETRVQRSSRLFMCFEQLRALGYKVQDPLNLTGAHVDALVKCWIEEKQYSDSTINNRLSALRVFCDWVGKVGIVKGTHEYATPERPLKRSGSADRDKSWSGNGVDVEAMVEKVFKLDDVVGAQLVAMSAFGLRAREARMLEPLLCIQDHQVLLIKGPKGGLSRVVPIETEQQRQSARWLKAFAEKQPVPYLGWRGRNLQQARRRMYYILEKAGITVDESGVTAHGLRHEYVHNSMIRMGLIPAVKGGTKDQMPTERRDLVFRYASRLTGHSRASITCAYSGSFHKAVAPEPTTPYSAAFYSLTPQALNPVADSPAQSSTANDGEQDDDEKK